MRLSRLVLVGAVLVGPVGLAQTATAKKGNTAVMQEDKMSSQWWAAKHAQVLEDLKSHADTQLLMVGDSITQNYEKAKLPDENFQPTWKTFYEPRKALNLGYSGDTTQNLLWRLKHGEVDGVQPKAAVVLIGTNNLAHPEETNEDIEAGIDEVVLTLERKLPKTKILLLGILPRGAGESRVDAVNAYLAAAYGENPVVTYLDIGAIFFKDGVLDASLYYDPRLPSHGLALHPDTNGQRMMAEAIEPTLAKMMGEAPRVPLAAMAEVNPAVVPVSALELDGYDWWVRHHAVVAVQRALQPKVVMIGDSITHYWGGVPEGAKVSGASSWAGLFGSTPVLNMGFGYDRTQNVLWRLREGEFAGISPEWVVLNIGTNNLVATANGRANTPAEVVEGISAIVKVVEERAPQCKVVLMAILPRGEKPDSRFRQPILETNKLLAKRFTGDARVTYLDVGASYLQPDGTLPKAMMSDGTHPTDTGYVIWADALKKLSVGQ